MNYIHVFYFRSKQMLSAARTSPILEPSPTYGGGKSAE